MEIKKFRSAKRLIEHYLFDPAYTPNSVLYATTTGRQGWVFRGQRDVSWPLLPLAHRDTTEWHRYTPQGPAKFRSLSSTDLPQIINLHLATQVHAELRAVLFFLEAADRMGIATPLNYDQFVAGHSEALNVLSKASSVRRDPKDLSRLLPADETIELARSLEEFPLPVALPSFALAQHYGVPTRLLDWSESPLVAAYFAAIGVCREAGSGPKEFAIIALQTECAQEKGSSLRIVKAPKYINPNQRAQRGLFTWIPDANARFRSSRKWVGLEDVVPTDSLVATTLPATEARALLQILWRLDVTSDALEPSLQGAASAIERLGLAFPRMPNGA